jgi:hypothetical protein
MKSELDDELLKNIGAEQAKNMKSNNNWVE